MISTASLLAACTINNGDSNPIALSGKLDTSGASSAGVGSPVLKADYVSAASIDLTQYTIVCATLTNPPQTAHGSVNADGTFKVDIPGGGGQPMSCYMNDSTGAKVADFLISDSSNKDLNGNDQTCNTTTITQNAAVGSVSFDPNAGEVTIPSTNLAGSIIPSTTDVSLFDPSGAWTISPVDFAVPSGVLPPCTTDHCDGPPNGQIIYLKLWQGTKTSGGTVYGLQVWNSQDAYTACGGKTGLTPSMESNLGINFTNNGSSDGPFTFTSTVSNFSDQVSGSTGTVNLTDNWKMDTAKAQWDIMPCQSDTITIGGVSYNGWKCGPDSGSNYVINLAGGCVDGNGNAVNVTDWSTVSSCTPAHDGNNINTNTCTGTATVNGVSKAVTCTNKYVYVNGSDTVQAYNTSFSWSDLNASAITSGTSCSSAPSTTNAQKIRQLQCYANYYWMSGMGDLQTSCLPKIQTDFTSNDPATFVNVDFRPNALVFMDEYQPFPDGSGGTLLTRRDEYRGVQVNDNNFVDCHVIDTDGIVMKKVSANKMLVTYQTSAVTTSTSKPACLANFSGKRTTYMFYLTK